MGDNTDYRIYIQSYDGVTATVTDKDGAQLNPSEVEIKMRAGMLHTAHLEFVFVNTDIVATPTNVSMACAICGFVSMHSCNRPEDGEDRLG